MSVGTSFKTWWSPKANKKGQGITLLHATRGRNGVVVGDQRPGIAEWPLRPLKCSRKMSFTLVKNCAPTDRVEGVTDVDLENTFGSQPGRWIPSSFFLKGRRRAPSTNGANAACSIPLTTFAVRRLSNSSWQQQKMEHRWTQSNYLWYVMLPMRGDQQVINMEKTFTCATRNVKNSILLLHDFLLVMTWCTAAEPPWECPPPSSVARLRRCAIRVLALCFSNRKNYWIFKCLMFFVRENWKIKTTLTEMSLPNLS